MLSYLAGAVCRGRGTGELSASAKAILGDSSGFTDMTAGFRVSGARDALGH